MRDRVDVGDSASNDHELVVKDLLIDPSVSGWGGPYLPYEAHATAVHYVETTISGVDSRVYVYELQDKIWGNDANFGPKCVVGEDTCYYFVVIMFTRNQTLARVMDEYIDNGDGLDKGKYRVHWLGGDNDHPVMYYRVFPTLKRR